MQGREKPALFLRPQKKIDYFMGSMIHSARCFEFFDDQIYMIKLCMLGCEVH